MTDDLNILMYARGKERYVLLYSDRSRAHAQLGKWAADDELSFSWMDAATCCVRIIEDHKVIVECGR